MAKISEDDLRNLSLQIMYLEYYWSIYLKSHKRLDFQHCFQIEAFIREHKYDSLLKVTYTRFTNKAIISEAQLREIHRYGKICSLLKSIIDRDATSIKESSDTQD